MELNKESPNMILHVRALLLGYYDSRFAYLAKECVRSEDCHILFFFN